MPSPIRPAYGQVWKWSADGINVTLLLITPTDAKFQGAWKVIRLDGMTTDDRPYEMYGLYPDRDPIEGYTFIDGDTK